MVKTYVDRETEWQVYQFSKGTRHFISPSGKYKIMLFKTAEIDKNRVVWQINILKRFGDKYNMIEKEYSWRDDAFRYVTRKSLRLGGVNA